MGVGAACLLASSGLGGGLARMAALDAAQAAASACLAVVCGAVNPITASISGVLQLDEGGGPNSWPDWPRWWPGSRSLPGSARGAGARDQRRFTGTATSFRRRTGGVKGGS